MKRVAFRCYFLSNVMDVLCMIPWSWECDYIQKKWCNYLFITEKWMEILLNWFQRHIRSKKCLSLARRTVSMKIPKSLRKILILVNPPRWKSSIILAETKKTCLKRKFKLSLRTITSASRMSTILVERICRELP